MAAVSAKSPTPARRGGTAGPAWAGCGVEGDLGATSNEDMVDRIVFSSDLLPDVRTQTLRFDRAAKIYNFTNVYSHIHNHIHNHKLR